MRNSLVIQTMPTATLAPHFPAEEVKRRLTSELENIAADAAMLRPEWEPLLDSMRVVGTVLVLEDLFPNCKISPDRVVRKGGYKNVADAVEDMVIRIERIVANKSQFIVEVGR
jgi:hypothetical protein